MTEVAPAPAKPATKAKTYRRTCPECGADFSTHTHDRLFCSDAHKAAFHNRSSKIGRSLVPLAMAWRDGRNIKGKGPEARARRASAARAFADLCRIIDAASADCRTNERMAPLEYVRRRWANEGTLGVAETTAGQQALDAKAARQAKAAAKAAAAPKS